MVSNALCKNAFFFRSMFVTFVNRIFHLINSLLTYTMYQVIDYEISNKVMTTYCRTMLQKGIYVFI